MRSFGWMSVCALAVCASLSGAQGVVVLPTAQPVGGELVERFQFASDGSVGPGWSRPDEIARKYFHDELPALFARTLVLDDETPQHAELRWIFTGPHAGFTVELGAHKVRIVERYYDSFGLYEGQGNYPEKKVFELAQQLTGRARTLTVEADSHLSVRVRVNGATLLEAPLKFDVTRHQLQWSAPRIEHAVMAGALQRPAAKTVAIALEPNKRHQTMLGFGGSPSIPAYEALSEEGKAAYWRLLKRYNLLLQREYPMGTELKPDLSNMDDLAEATPHYYGDNFPNGEVSSFAYNKKILALGGDVIYELWALPRWATEQYSGPRVIDAWNKAIRQQAKPDEYARIVAEFCKKEKEKTGVAPAIVGIGNEVEQPAATYAATTRAVRHALDAAGFATTKIHMADAPYMYMGTARVRDLALDAAAWKVTDYTAAHEYDFQEFAENPDLYDDRLRAMKAAMKEKNFLATEICLNDARLQEASYRVALAAAQLYHKNLTELDAVGLMYCWLLLDVEQPSFGASRSLLVPDRTKGWTAVPSSFQLRVLGAYSRHVRKGMQRVEATTTDSDLMTSAFADAKDATLVALNRGTEPRRLQMTGAAQWVEMERTGVEEENAVSAVPHEIVVAPGEIVVLSTIKAE